MRSGPATQPGRPPMFRRLADWGRRLYIRWKYTAGSSPTAQYDRHLARLSLEGLTERVVPTLMVYKGGAPFTSGAAWWSDGVYVPQAGDDIAFWDGYSD